MTRPFAEPIPYPDPESSPADFGLGRIITR